MHFSVNNVNINYEQPHQLLINLLYYFSYQLCKAVFTSPLWDMLHSLKMSLLRYVGENYSNAQEAMEEVMHSFYSQSSAQHPLTNPTVGQLVAVRGEEGEELARAQVMEVIAPGKVKVSCT